MYNHSSTRWGGFPDFLTFSVVKMVSPCEVLSGTFFYVRRIFRKPGMFMNCEVRVNY